MNRYLLQRIDVDYEMELQVAETPPAAISRLKHVLDGVEGEHSH